MSSKFDFSGLFIFEMANNHQGSVEHGVRIIKEMAAIARQHGVKAGVKFQYRDLDTFIHPDYRHDTKAKHISRFLSTELTAKQFKVMVDACVAEGLVTICTPFDERSVDLIVEHGIEVIKIASCSADDWPLIAKIVQTDKPIIASTGGIDIHQIDSLVSFLSHKNKNFAILHCVGIYPSPNDTLNLNFVKKLKSRYPDITIGYSGHEDPENTDVVKIAAAVGAEIFERHVGVPTDTITLNNYSMNPEQVEKWLSAYVNANVILGEDIKALPAVESESLLSLKRGVFVNRTIKKGETILPQDVYFAMPCQEGQLTSGEFGRLRARFVASQDYTASKAVFETYTEDNYHRIRKYIHQAKGMMAEAGIVLNDKAEVELSYHYGVDRFEQFGCVLVNLVNREYCKKIIVMFAGQHHPEQKHLKKEETFHVMSGSFTLTMNGISRTLSKGDIITLERGDLHAFYSEHGVIFEEISTTHFRNDSFYTDTLIMEQDPLQRKLIVEEF
jgi:sialic acid synthase SpsE/quercetin dioxygenase-like cupin family protein